MDEDKMQDKTCGCNCEACMRGDHESCEHKGTGMCKWDKPKDDDEDEA